MADPTRAPAFAMPVYLAPAPGALAYNIPNLGNYTIVADGAGYVSGVSVNTPSEVSGATIALYDGDPDAGGTLIGTWSFKGAVGFIGAAAPYSNGLYAVCQPAPGGGDATISYVPAG